MLAAASVGEKLNCKMWREWQNVFSYMKSMNPNVAIMLYSNNYDFKPALRLDHTEVVDGSNL